ncbi:MAG TPA: twin-arginine translocation signal domain-containing protein [Actinomycetes bacterium]|jgi:hypothetical protein|nr:twin-arginine translocation signal domain-containing protein [Actinomycetes bacterium]
MLLDGLKAAANNTPAESPSLRLLHDGPPGGHDHFWRRMVSRRGFLATTGATGALLASGALAPQWALASSGSDPRPIPGGITVGGTLFHVFLPGFGNEPSTIFDFRGTVGLAQVGGTVTRTDTVTGVTEQVPFDIDNRFMQGTYVGIDGQRHHGTFGFI